MVEGIVAVGAVVGKVCEELALMPRDSLAARVQSQEPRSVSASRFRKIIAEK
jgi:hypothetical protein